jgi:4-hydroxybenzoate polyprenyltransferase
MAFDAVLRDPSPPAWRSWIKAVRVHQSLKNVLVFLPLIAAHEFTELSSVLAALGAFFAFTLMAFGVYLLNDTMDLAADRAHHRKRLRPLADGRISPIAALTVTVVLAIASIALGALIGPAFVAVLLIYAVMTTTYSFWLKRVALVDIVVLALLYMIRIVAGATATGIALSFWFTAVTLFLFLSLALVKRYAEAHQAREVAGVIPGRGYSGDDVHAILALGTATGVAAVLLTAIYIQSDAVTVIYPAPGALWLVIPVFFYWIANLWLKAGRGEMHDDPLVFALRDRASLAAAALIVAVVIAASLPLTATVVGAT